MKKFSKPISTIILICILLISTMVISIAEEVGDPGGGKCYIVSPISNIQYNK